MSANPSASKQGATFFGQVRSQAIAIFYAVQYLVWNFVQTASVNPSLSNDDKTYLLRMMPPLTNARCHLPSDNLGAALHSWRSNSNVIKDTPTEHEELSQPQGGSETDSNGEESAMRWTLGTMPWV